MDAPSAPESKGLKEILRYTPPRAEVLKNCTSPMSFWFPAALMDYILIAIGSHPLHWSVFNAGWHSSRPLNSEIPQLSNVEDPNVGTKGATVNSDSEVRCDARGSASG